MKRSWVSPVNETQRFVPQEFIAACAQPTHWVATCRTESSLVFKLDGDYSSDMNRGGCGKSHEFVLENGLKPEANCYILPNVRTREPGTVTIEDYLYMFSSYPEHYDRFGHVTSNWNNGVGFVLKSEYYSELVEAYYNDDVLDGNSMLVTDDIANIKNPS